ncbi:septal ring lytic transglycosylase RlpA family protein [Ferruginibacter lapsinanis]|uniref:septal ring lytic transglycosylase RlpA family protein n=1 Tax=Ferruginibacter lapsinanis TaxID=563172 RepID=UPI001E4B91F4|nr:septal ring lytic transglycosylase RlpA family protein [Ferruginibacter lapsinanis]UEG49009.1 septal ring lytic transglycosylase RlpA family protein [Ferruginibacter lapsinanis]
MSPNNQPISLSILFRLFAVLLFCSVLSFQLVAQSKKNVGKVLYGQASFYGNKFNGRKTASGEVFSQTKYTCACNALPLGTWVKVTNLRNGRSVIVKVNDRIHPKVRRVVDLSKIAAMKLAFVASGLTRVKVEVLPKGKY